MAVLIRFFFWWYTGRIWEDSLITVLHSENFVGGLGMTHYRTGQPPLHGFTSPLSVLVPLVGDLFRVGFGLDFIRIVSAFCGGLTVLRAAAIGMHPRVALPRPAVLLVVCYLAFEHHQIMWGAAGMETQIVTLVIFMSIYYMVAWRPVLLGASLGLCMLARPDLGFWTVIVGLYVLVRRPRSFLTVAGVALAVYLPWIVFTTLYYGSPIPNTIYAKTGYTVWTRNANLTWEEFREMVASMLMHVSAMLGPAFAGHGTGVYFIGPDRGILALAMFAAAYLGGVFALLRRQYELLAVLAFVAVYSSYYVFLVPIVFGWYLAPFVAVVMLLVARGLAGLTTWLRGPRIRGATLSAIVGGYLAYGLSYLPTTIAAEKQIQEQIENNVRKAAGLYLSGVMGRDESVGCEPLGYIAYYSRRTVFDWPGLANRRVVEFTRSHPGHRGLLDMLRHFKPDYLFLRRHEYAHFLAIGETWLTQEYQVDRWFEAPWEKVKDILLIEQNVDCSFVILRRKDGSQTQASQTS